MSGRRARSASARAEALAAEHGYAIIPPYDDPAIIAGQGTCGLEILADCPEVDLVLAPVGGGGLLSGVAAAIRQQRPECQVIGVEPELAGDAAASLRQGKLVQYTAEQTTRTLADGLRTQSLGDAELRPHPALCRSRCDRNRAGDRSRPCGTSRWAPV